MVKSMGVLLVFFLIMLMLSFLQFFLSKKKHNSFMSPSPLEAGFESLKMINMLFSSPLVLMGMLFVMFDLEIIFLIPLSFFEKNFFFYFLFILWFLIISLCMEWKFSGLNWQT